jgi:ubiquinone/menaquinone biosynthesis C-methylase UbiE
MQLTVLPRLVDQIVRYSLVADKLPPPPARICEIGIGGGWLLKALDAHGYDVHGCDKSVPQELLESPLGSRIRQTSGCQLDYPDNYFDATLSCDVLEHVSPHDRDSFLSELIRITKPGGLVVLTAFFTNTKAFRLWGVGQLLAHGSLPSWYCEHLTIPLPRHDRVLSYLQQNLEDLYSQEYQRAFNLLGMWIQCNCPGRIISSRVCDIIAKGLLHIDIFGRPTSRLYHGVKKLP